MQKNCYSSKKLRDILHQKLSRILIIGDACVDINHYGKVNRISPEAPVPIFDYEYTTETLGMAENVCENVRKLHNNITAFTQITGEKNRYIDLKSHQQIFRVDKKNTPENCKNLVENCIEELSKNDVSLLIISDYNKGTLSYEDIERLINVSKSKNIDVFIDTKKPDLKRFEGAILKINEYEFKSSISKSSRMIVTQSDKSVLFYDNNISKEYPVTKKELLDATGAGDTFLAFVSVIYSATKDMDYAISIAIKASQETIRHRGCYAPTLEEIL